MQNFSASPPQSFLPSKQIDPMDLHAKSVNCFFEKVTSGIALTIIFVFLITHN